MNTTMITRDELIQRISEHSEQIKKNLDLYQGILERTNYVVVSMDFTYCVTDDGTGMLDVKVICSEDVAQRFSETTAIRVADSFKAWNGYGKIEWDVMPIRVYLNKLLEQNNRVLALLSNKD